MALFPQLSNEESHRASCSSTGENLFVLRTRHCWSNWVRDFGAYIAQIATSGCACLRRRHGTNGTNHPKKNTTGRCHWAGAFNVDVSLKSSARLIAIYRLPMELCLQFFGFSAKSQLKLKLQTSKALK